MRRAFLLVPFLSLLPLALLGCSGDDTNPIDGDAGDQDGATGPDGQVITPDGSLPPDSGPSKCGAITCAATETCLNDAVCACKPGFVPQATGPCIAAPADNPASHTQTDVCKQWKDGHVVTTPSPYTKGAQQCDLGTFSAGGINDTLARINMFRWMELEAPVTEDAAKSANEQACAVIHANNNPSSMPNPHSPPNTATCYTTAGGTAAGQSNLAWGTSTGDSIDLYMREPGAGNAGSLGHRRWVINPALGKVGIGFVATGTNSNGYGGQAQCLGVFDTTGSGQKPTWLAFPPPGYVPVQITPGVLNQGWAWSFGLKQGGLIGNAKITVKNLTTNADAPVTIKTLGQGYGAYDTISFYPNGWTPAAGSVYRVTVDVGSAKYVYDVMPVTCP